LRDRRYLFGPADDQFESSIFYLALESPGLMISPRDFVLSRFLFRISDDRLVYFHISIDNAQLAPPNKDFVRGEMLFQGYVIDKLADGNVKLTFLAQADPKGSIPAWAYNSTAMKQGYVAKAIRKKVLQEVGKK
jgi:hypothetical protein